jgi:hypothetical protein
MGFGKEEYVDYTLLKKKGILKIPEQKKLPIKSEGGFVDFTAFGSHENNAQETPTNNFGFLGDMASAGAANNPSSANPLANFDTLNTPAGSAAGLSNNMDAKEMGSLKIKIENMEYKLDRFIERIDRIEEKLRG